MTKKMQRMVVGLLMGTLICGTFVSDANAWSLKPPKWARDAWNGTIRDPIAKIGDNLASLCVLEFKNNTKQTLRMSVGSTTELVAPGGSVRAKVGMGESRQLTARDPKTGAILFSGASSKATPGKTISRSISQDKNGRIQ